VVPRGRNVAIEGTLPLVLGLIDDAGRRIHGDGLVRETPRRAYGSTAAGAEPRHVEDVAVVEPVGAAPPRVERLLAREPAPPRRGATGAVADRAAEARPRAHEPALHEVEHEVRRAAVLVGVVHAPVDEALVPGAPAELMVAHERDMASAPSDHGHAVVIGGRRAT